MTRQFLPDYRAVPTTGGWRPSFRLFVGEGERLVPYKDGPKFFPSREAAVAAAKEHVQRILNPTIRAEKIEAPVPEIASEVQDFLARRDQEAEEERTRVFGSDGPAMVFPRRGKPVQVERRRARA